MYFDGTNDYLPSYSPIYAFGSSDFTVESWCYFKDATANVLREIWVNYNSWAANAIFFGKHTNATGKVQVWINNYNANAPFLTDPTLPPINAWVHYALVRSGNNWNLYRDGASVASIVWSGSATTNTLSQIGGNPESSGINCMYGYLSNFRISRAAITPPVGGPSSPVGLTTNTALLANFTNSRIVDSSQETNLEYVGNTQNSFTVTKFTNNTTYFDGLGDWIKTTEPIILGSGPFTVESWVYFNENLGYYDGEGNYTSALIGGIDTTNGVLEIIFSSGTISGAPTSIIVRRSNLVNIMTASNLNIPLRSWNHIAVSKDSSGIYRIFLNGVSVGTQTFNNNSITTSRYGIGGTGNTNYLRNFSGYLSNLRITNLARYTDDFTLPPVPSSTW